LKISCKSFIIIPDAEKIQGIFCLFRGISPRTKRNRPDDFPAKNKGRFTLKKNVSKSVITGIIIFLLPLIAAAEWFILEDLPGEKTKLSLRFLHPNFKEPGNLTFFSGIYDFSIRKPLGDKLNIIGTLPFSTMRAGGESESGIGNIYMGIQYSLKSTAETKAHVSLGVFLPTVAKDKSSIGIMGVFSDYCHFPKYLTESVTIYGNAAYHRILSSEFMLGLEVGPYVIISTSSDNDDYEGDIELYDDKAELFLHYGISGGYLSKYVTLTAEFAGVMIVTEKVDDFSDRVFNVIAVGAQWNRGSIRPGIFYKFFMETYMKEIMNGVLGIKVDIILKK
jgi:hypothetical protein